MPKRGNKIPEGNISVVDSEGNLAASYSSVANASKLTGKTIEEITSMCNSSFYFNGLYWDLHKPITLDDVDNFVTESFTSKFRKPVTHANTWKSFERTVATDFNSVRSPLSGALKNITNSDTLNEHIYVECKLRSGNNFNFYNLFSDKRIPENISCMVIESGDEVLWVMFREDFLKLVKAPTYKPELIKIVVKSKVYKSLLSLYRETVERAEIENKIPIVAVKKKNTKSYLVGSNPNNFEALHNILKTNDNVSKRKRRG